MLLCTIDRTSYVCVEDIVLSNKYIEAGAELPQIIKRVCPLENEQRQQNNSAYIGHKQQYAYTAETASYTGANRDD